MSDGMQENSPSKSGLGASTSRTQTPFLRQTTNSSEHLPVPHWRSDTAEPGIFSRSALPLPTIVLDGGDRSASNLEDGNTQPPVNAPHTLNVPPGLMGVRGSSPLGVMTDEGQASREDTGNASQRLRHAISRSESPANGNSGEGSSPSAVTRTLSISELQRSHSKGGKDLSITPITQRGARDRAPTTVTVPRFTSHLNPEDVGHSHGSGKASNESHTRTNTYYTPLAHQVSLSTSSGKYEQQQGSTTKEGIRIIPTYAKLAPGFDRNQQAAVFFSPMHFEEPLVIPIREGGGNRHRTSGEVGHQAPIFSALGAGGGGAGSPIFGPSHSSAFPSAFNVDEDQLTGSMVDALSGRSKQLTSGGLGSTATESILSALSRRRGVLPARAAAQAVAVANDNIAAAGLLQPASSGDTSSGSPTTVHYGGPHVSQSVSGAYLSPLTPTPTSALAGLRGSSGTAPIHRVPNSAASLGPSLTNKPTHNGDVDDPLQLAKFDDTANAPGTTIKITPEGSTSAVSGTIHPLPDGAASSSIGPMGRRMEHQKRKKHAPLAYPFGDQRPIVAVHKYQRPGLPGSTNSFVVAPTSGPKNEEPTPLSFATPQTSTPPPSVSLPSVGFGGTPAQHAPAQVSSKSFQQLGGSHHRESLGLEATHATPPPQRSFRYAPLYYNLDTSLSALQNQQMAGLMPTQQQRPSLSQAVPMPSFVPIEGGEMFPDSYSDAGDESQRAQDESGGLRFDVPQTQKIAVPTSGQQLTADVRQSKQVPQPATTYRFGSIDDGDSPPLITAARRAAEAAKKRQRRKDRRERPPFKLPPTVSAEEASAMAVGIAPPVAKSPRAARPLASVPEVVYSHPQRDPLASLLRSVTPLSVPLTWLLEIRRDEERYFLTDTVRHAQGLGLVSSPTNNSPAAAGLTMYHAHALPTSQKVSVLQSMPPPPFLSPKAIATESILDAPTTHGLFASFERSGTLVELSRFCQQYPDALHFIERVLQEIEDPLSVSNKVISFKKTSLAKDIIEGKERRRQRRMEKKGKIEADLAALPMPSPTSQTSEESTITNSSDDEGSDLEDLLLNNLGTNPSYQMDVVLPLFPQLEDMVTLLKASCQATVCPDDGTEEEKQEVQAAAITVDRLISALDPGLHSEPALSWPFHVLCSLVCFYVTALKVGFIPLLKSLRKGSLASSGKGLLAALAVSLTCKECLAIDDISGVDPEVDAETLSPKDVPPPYNPLDPFHYTNRNSEAEGRFHADEEHQHHDLALRKFLKTEAERSIPSPGGHEVATQVVSRNRELRLNRYRQQLTRMGASPSYFCTLEATTDATGGFATSNPGKGGAGMDQPSYHAIATASDDYNTFERVEGGGSDHGDDLSGSAQFNREAQKEQEVERRKQLVALQNERCEPIFFTHCVEVLRAAQGVGLALESIRSVNNIQPTMQVAPDGTIVEPDPNEEESIDRAAESGADSTTSSSNVCSSDGQHSRQSYMAKHAQKKHRKRRTKAVKDTISNVNYKCSILVVNVDVTVLRILIGAANTGLSSWVGVESSIAAAAAARRKDGGREGSGGGMSSGDEKDFDAMSDFSGIRNNLSRQQATLKSAENPNSASRGAGTVVGFIEISRVLCSRSSIVTGHPTDIARLDLLLIQYGAFCGEKIHRDKLPIEVPENHSIYCGDVLQAAIMRLWKGVQHGYTYRANYNKLLAQRRKARAIARIQKRSEKMLAKERYKQERMERRRKLSLKREAALAEDERPLQLGKHKRPPSNANSIDSNYQTEEELIERMKEEDSTTTSSDEDDAEVHYYADLAALAAETAAGNGDGDGDEAEDKQDLHDFEKATRFFLTFLVHPSELGIDVLHPCTGESMMRVKGESLDNAQRKGTATTMSQVDDIEDALLDRIYHNNDPSAQYRAKFGGGYMNKARLKDAWSFMEALATAIASPNQNLNASVDTMKHRGALRQRKHAAKHEEADEVLYTATRQAQYDDILQGCTDPQKVSADALTAASSLEAPAPSFASVSRAGRPQTVPPPDVASRYNHSKELLLDFSFSRLRVGQVLAWAHSSTAVTSKNALNSAVNDVLCVPQPMDMLEQIGGLLKPPRRGTRSDIVSRTWLQLALINEALGEHVPKTEGGTESQTLSAFDVTDAKLLDAKGRPRIYSTSDSFVQLQLLRPVFYHVVGAAPNGSVGAAEKRMAAPGVAATSSIVEKPTSDNESDSDDAPEGSIVPIDTRNKRQSSTGSFVETVKKAGPSFVAALTTSLKNAAALQQQQRDAFDSTVQGNETSTNPMFPFASDSLMLMGASTRTQVPFGPPSATDVHHLLCFIGSLSCSSDLSALDQSKAPWQQDEGQPGSLLAAFDAAVLSTIPTTVTADDEKIAASRKLLKTWVRSALGDAMPRMPSQSVAPDGDSAFLSTSRLVQNAALAAAAPNRSIWQSVSPAALYPSNSKSNSWPPADSKGTPPSPPAVPSTAQWNRVSKAGTPLIGTLLNASRFRAWTEEGYDVGPGVLARRRRLGVDLALDPSFAIHLMNVERHQRLSLQKGIRYLGRKEKEIALYERTHSTSGNDDHVLANANAIATPAPPLPAAFDRKALTQEFSFHWLRTLLTSNTDIVENPDSVDMVSIVEPSSRASYDALKAMCDYEPADVLAQAGGGRCLRAGMVAAAEAADSLTPALSGYLYSISDIYLGAEGVAQITELLEGLIPSKQQTPALNPSNFAPGSSQMATSSPLSIHTPQKPSTAAVDGADISRQSSNGGIGGPLSSGSSVFLQPMGLSIPVPPLLSPSYPASSAGDRDRRQEGSTAPGSGGALDCSTVESNKSPEIRAAQDRPRDRDRDSQVTSRAPTPSMKFNAASTLRESIAGIGTSSSDDSTTCPHCGTKLANPRALLIHVNYCEATVTNVPSEGSSDRTPNTHPRSNSVTSNGNNATPSLIGTGMTATNGIRQVKSNDALGGPTSSHTSSATSPVGPSGGSFDRLMAGITGSAPQRPLSINEPSLIRSQSSTVFSNNTIHSPLMGSPNTEGSATQGQQGGGGGGGASFASFSAPLRFQRTDSSLIGGLGERVKSEGPASSISWLVNREGAQPPKDEKVGHSTVTVVDMTGEHPQISKGPMQSPARTPTASTAPQFPPPLTPRSAMRGGNASFISGFMNLPLSSGQDDATVVQRVKQAAMLHAFLLGNRTRDGGPSVEREARPVMPTTPEQLPNKPKRQKKTEQVTVIDAASAVPTSAVGGSAYYDSEVLNSYQYLSASPSLKNEADAVVLDLLQYISTLKSNLLMKQEQLYQQATVAFLHLQQLRKIVLANPLAQVPPRSSSSFSPLIGEPLVSNPYIQLALLAHHIRQLVSAINGCKRRREVLRQVANNYHRVKTGVMLTPQAVKFTQNLANMTDLPFPPYTLLLCPTVLQLLDFWDALEFSTFYCGC